MQTYPLYANTVPEYFDYLEKTYYQENLTDYQLLTVTEKADGSTVKGETGKATTAELDSLQYVFTFTYHEKSYRILQALFVKGSYIYTFTYTASEELYESHLAEAESILAAIQFD